jgi:aminopeptidase N
VSVLRTLAGTACCFILLSPAPGFGEPTFRQPTISHHALSVELRPDSHELIVTDRLTVHVPDGLQAVTFSLAPSLHVDRITAADPDPSSGRPAEEMAFRRETPEGDHVVVRLPDHRSEWTLEWRYRGIIHDPPREPRHLRFVTPSETSGHIGPDGVYLSSESRWYPDLPGSLASYEAQAALPNGWSSVSQGSDATGSGHWSVTVPSEALTLVANRFVVATRDWQASNGQTIKLATYLLPEDAHLAEEYLDASARYLNAYIPLLGPYPFPKFAVVENFFSSGLGMPSFTLLGAAVIKRHYTQPYALGHEIVHSWIGNGVYNRVNQGNWVEGLTTYLANYYYHELTGDEAKAREQRRLMLFGYAVYVRPEQDYPIARFTQKTDEKDNAIGYQKTAMVFHMLRREVGDAAFWTDLKDLIAGHLGAYADWSDIERTFGTRHGRDLRWFFAQWVERPGAPRVIIADARVHHAGQRSAPAKFLVSATVLQQGAAYRIPIDVQFQPASQDAISMRIEMTDAEASLTARTSEPVHSLVIDPDFHLFRRLERHELPAMLNLFVTDTERTIGLPAAETGNQKPFAGILQRVRSQEAAKPEDDRTRISETSALNGVKNAGSILVMGYGDEQVASTVRENCGDRFATTPSGFKVGGAVYEGSRFALLVSCPRRGAPGSVVSFLYGVTPESVSIVTRLLFFYGWNSYVVFKDGAVVGKGDWEMDMKREVIVE